MSGRPERYGRAGPGRADVWLGDLVVAVTEVAPRDEGEFWRVARLLGLGQRQPSRIVGPGAVPEMAANTVALLEPIGAVPSDELPMTAITPADGKKRERDPDTTTDDTPTSRAGGGSNDPSHPKTADGSATDSTGAADGSGEVRDDDSAQTTGGDGTTDVPDDADEVGRDSGPPRRALRPVGTVPLPQTWLRDSVPRPDRHLMSRQPPYVPLLARKSAAALLEAALSGSAPDGDVEIENAVELLARGLPLAALPRRMRRTLRHGVQILVDQGPAMQLFSRDQTQLCAQVEALVGKDKTALLRFAYAPLRGTGPGPVWMWEAYRPPPRGSAVLVLSDCGTIGPPGDHYRSAPAEWQRFAELVRRNGARPLALLPVPERRVPEWLAAIMPVLSWDRGTTVGHVAARVNAWRESRRTYGLLPAGEGSQG